MNDLEKRLASWTREAKEVRDSPPSLKAFMMCFKSPSNAVLAWTIPISKLNSSVNRSL